MVVTSMIAESPWQARQSRQECKTLFVSKSHDSTAIVTPMCFYGAVVVL